MARRAGILLPTGVALLVVVGCSTHGGSTPAASDLTTSTSPSTAVATEPTTPVLRGRPEDLARIRAAVDAVDHSSSAAYDLQQTIKVPGENSIPLITRSGDLDFGRGLHEVQIDFVDLSSADQTPHSLTFLLSPARVLMDNPSATATTGTRWTLLPARQLAALSQGESLAPALPGADVLRQAQAALPTVSLPDRTALAVYVKEYDALPLLNATAAEQLQHKTGKGVPELRQEYDTVLEIGVDLDAEGRLSALNADLTAMAAHYSKSMAEPTDPNEQLTLQEHIFDVGLPPKIDKPADSDIANAPLD